MRGFATSNQVPNPRHPPNKDKGELNTIYPYLVGAKLGVDCIIGIEKFWHILAIMWELDDSVLANNAAIPPSVPSSPGVSNNSHAVNKWGKGWKFLNHYKIPLSIGLTHGIYLSLKITKGPRATLCSSHNVKSDYFWQGLNPQNLCAIALAFHSRWSQLSTSTHNQVIGQYNLFAQNSIVGITKVLIRRPVTWEQLVIERRFLWQTWWYVGLYAIP